MAPGPLWAWRCICQCLILEGDIVAMPLTGHQRQTLTALYQIRDGKDTDAAAKIIRQTYTYLTDLEALQVVADARKLQAAVKMYMSAGPEAKLSDYYDDANGAPWYIASADVTWMDRKGRKQTRTIRVRVPKDATKAQVDQLLRDEATAMLTAGKVDSRGNVDYEEDMEE